MIRNCVLRSTNGLSLSLPLSLSPSLYPPLSLSPLLYPRGRPGRPAVVGSHWSGLGAQVFPVAPGYMSLLNRDAGWGREGGGGGDGHRKVHRAGVMSWPCVTQPYSPWELRGQNTIHFRPH